MPVMRRRLTAALLGGAVLACILGALIIGGKLGLATSTPHKPLATPTPTVQPVSTQTVPPKHHQRVVLSADFVSFVDNVCREFAAGRSGQIANNLMYYQYNTEAYYGPFDLSGGQFALPSNISSWMGTRVRCVRLAEPYAGHGVLATRGWNQTGGWGILDLDIAPGRSQWRINDFTFGSRAQVMGAFFANDPASVGYRAKV
jgi:hypothetical protein